MPQTQAQLPSGISVRVRQDLTEGTRATNTLIIDPIITADGHRVTQDDIGEIGYGKIDANNPREEIISWTGITDNGNTYTLTGVVWGINFYNREGGVSDNMKRHISGAEFSLNTDMHYLAEKLDNYVLRAEFNVEDNEIGWGDGTTNEDKVLQARNGDSNLPFIKYSESTNKWLISNDGVNTYDVTTGGDGLSAGDGVTFDESVVNVNLDQLVDDNGLTVQDNRLNLVLNTDTGIYKDTNGIGLDVIDPDNLPVDPTDDAYKLVRLGSDGITPIEKLDTQEILDDAFSNGYEVPLDNIKMTEGSWSVGVSGNSGATVQLVDYSHIPQMKRSSGNVSFWRDTSLDDDYKFIISFWNSSASSGSCQGKYHYHSNSQQGVEVVLDKDDKVIGLHIAEITDKAMGRSINIENKKETKVFVLEELEKMLDTKIKTCEDIDIKKLEEVIKNIT